MGRASVDAGLRDLMAADVLRFRVSRWRILAARLFVRALVVLVWIVRPVPAEGERIVAWARRVLPRFVSRGIHIVPSHKAPPATRAWVVPSAWPPLRIHPRRRS